MEADEIAQLVSPCATTAEQTTITTARECVNERGTESEVNDDDTGEKLCSCKVQTIMKPDIQRGLLIHLCANNSCGFYRETILKPKNNVEYTMDVQLKYEKVTLRFTKCETDDAWFILRYRFAPKIPESLIKLNSSWRKFVDSEKHWRVRVEVLFRLPVVLSQDEGAELSEMKLTPIDEWVKLLARHCTVFINYDVSAIKGKTSLKDLTTVMMNVAKALFPDSWASRFGDDESLDDLRKRCRQGENLSKSQKKKKKNSIVHVDLAGDGEDNDNDDVEVQEILSVTEACERQRKEADKRGEIIDLVDDDSEDDGLDNHADDGQQKENKVEKLKSETNVRALANSGDDGSLDDYCTDDDSEMEAYFRLAVSSEYDEDSEDSDYSEESEDYSEDSEDTEQVDSDNETGCGDENGTSTMDGEDPKVKKEECDEKRHDDETIQNQEGSVEVLWLA